MQPAPNALLDRISDGVLALDGVGRVGYLNSRAIELLGVDQRDILGRAITDLQPAELGVELGRGFAEMQRSDGSIAGEMKLAGGRCVEYGVHREASGATVILRDVTESREHARKLRESQARFRTVFDQIGIGIAITDAEGRTIDSNPELQRMLGYSPEELRELNVSDLTHPEDLARDVERATEVVEGQTSGYRIEKRYVRKDGSVFWAKLTGALLPPDGDGHSRGVGLVEDITERRRSEEATRRQAIVFDVLEEGVIILDPLARIVDLNAGAERMFGYSAAEVVGLEPSFLHHPSVRGRLRDEIVASIRNTGKWDGEFPFVRKDGTDGICHLTTVSYTDPEGRVAGHVGVNRDVTARYRFEQALREGEEKFRQIAENVREIFWIFTPDFSRAIYVNPSLEALTGVKPEEIYADGRAFLRPVHPDDLPMVEEAMERIRNEETLQGIEFRMLHPTGVWRWFSARGYPVKNEKGEVYRIVGTSEDITDRKNALALLRVAEEHYRRLVETSPYMVFAVDSEGRFTEVNQAAATLLGRVPSELFGIPFTDIFSWDEAEGGGDELWKTLDGRSHMAEVEVRVAHASGETRLVHIRSTAIRNDLGEVAGAHGVVRDITRERESEQTMRLLTTALESFDSGVCITDRELNILYANAAYARLLGPGREAIAGTGIEDLLPRTEETSDSQEAPVSADEGQRTGRVWVRRAEDDREVALDVIAGAVQAPTGERNLFLIINDATNAIEREGYLRRVERLASVGTLLGGVAHELNNPLHAIRSFADLMLMDGREGDDLEALQIIEREADRAAKIVSDLRLIARDTQTQDEARQPVDLNDVVRHVLKVRRYSLETASIEIREDLADNPPEILAQRGEIEQVVINLIVNAEQAMQLQEGVRRLVVRTRRSPGGASVHIVDSGAGIAPQHLERIFDPFFTTKAPGEGTGLGLPLVHSIVTEHGGTIYVDSEPGKGTAFRVNFPRADLRVEAVGKADVPPPSHRLKILVVDDEETIRSGSARFLRRLGHTVETAAEGADALRLVGRGNYDVVVSDLRMPGLGGDELYRLLREQGNGLDRRIIFMTGDAARASQLITDARIPVLLKPVKLEDLATAVEGVARWAGSQ